MSETAYTVAAVSAAAIITWLTRGLPYLMFGGKRKLPKIVTFLGTVLPSAIMIILVVYCLRSINITTFPYGLVELISVLLVIVMQTWKKNTLLSILIGTACYMILIRTVF